MSSMRLKKEIDKIKRENQQKFKHRKREHKNNKKVARREGYPGESNGRSKNPKSKFRNKSTQAIK